MPGVNGWRMVGFPEPEGAAHFVDPSITPRQCQQSKHVFRVGKEQQQSAELSICRPSRRIAGTKRRTMLPVPRHRHRHASWASLPHAEGRHPVVSRCCLFGGHPETRARPQVNPSPPTRALPHPLCALAAACLASLVAADSYLLLMCACRQERLWRLQPLE